jgi:phosphoserine phosphatase
MDDKACRDKSLCLRCFLTENETQTEPLPSWNEGAAKESIFRFVEAVTTEGGAEFVPPLDRIAVLDNDGTLWSEKPFYFQLIFALDRVKALAAQHPEWKNQQPFKAVIEDDLTGFLAGGMKAILDVLIATHSGNTTDEFEQIVLDWIASARHPRTGRLYTEMVFQPMLELLDYLRANGFRTYIVSGGGIEFMRAWVEEVYGVPPEQVIGSSIETRFEMRDGGPVLIRTPKVDFVDDNEGKPVGIHKFIGRRPILAFGNSDGDHEMLQWTAAGGGARFMGLVHHTDAQREWAYDRDSLIGRLDKALDEAYARGWTIVDMKSEWRVIYPWESMNEGRG